MYTATFIRRHINNLNNDKPFSIRDFLSYGTREAVDQVFHRLVKSGRIIRVARGVFIKDSSPFPSILEIAKVKASAFAKRIAIHGKEIVSQLGLNDGEDKDRDKSNDWSGNKEWNENSDCRQEENKEWHENSDWSTNKEIAQNYFYACTGRSSSFRFGDTRIYFRGTSPRKMFMGDNPIGLAIRALWYLGEALCNMEIISTVLASFNRTDRQMLGQSAYLMPAWMHKKIPSMNRF